MQILRRALITCTIALAIAACSSGTGEPSRPGASPPATALPTTTTTSPYGAGWSAVHADAANSDYSAERGPDRLVPAWTEQITGSMRIGPLPWTINLGATFDASGRAYVTSTESECHLRSFDLSTGQVRWCQSDLDLFAVVSGPLLGHDGMLYVADGAGMHAIGPDGVQHWTVPLDGVPLSTQFTPDGRLVFVTHVGTAYVLDRTDGAQSIEPIELAPGTTWSASAGMMACARGTEACPSANTIAVGDDGHLYFTLWAPGRPAAGVQAMQYVTGDQPRLEARWTNDSLPGGSASSPVISADGTRVYVTDNVDGLHALDAATGETIWSVTIGYAAGGSPSLSPDGLIMPAGGRTSPTLAVRDQGDEGVIAWQRDDLLNRGIATQADGDRAYVTVDIGANRCALVVIDTTDGSDLDRHELDGPCVFSVGTTISRDGTVLVPTLVGGIHAFVPAPADVAEPGT